MEALFDRNLWDKHITKDSWYLILKNDFDRINEATKEWGTKERKDIFDEIYDYLQDKLDNGDISLMEKGPNMDDERKEIDTVVIHHTSRSEDLSLGRLNVMHMIRLYAPYFANPQEEHQNIKGKSLWSGHFMKNKQVFYAYHWLVRKDGTTERLLDSNYIGWHAGNWDMNCKSIAICLDDDLENKEPSRDMMVGASKIIKEHYAEISIQNILGHTEVNKCTICPGNTFLTKWKSELLELVT